MDDLISREWLIEAVEEGWIKFDTEKDKNRFIHLVRDIAPSAQSERKSCKTCHLWENGELNIACPWGSNYEHYEDDYCSLWEKQN